MTDTNLTEIVAIIDRSGSMALLKVETIGGFNSFIEEQKKTPGKAVLTLVQFDDRYQIDYDGVDLNDVKPLNEATYVPRGMTALRDAIGTAVNTIGKRLAGTEESKRPSKIIVLVITDGHENSSREFTNAQIKEMIEHQTNKYNWSFVFLGGASEANFAQQEEQGRDLGFGANAMSFSNSSRGVGAVYDVISRSVSRRRLSTDDQVVALISEDEKLQLKS